MEGLLLAAVVVQSVAAIVAVVFAALSARASRESISMQRTMAGEQRWEQLSWIVEELRDAAERCRELQKPVDEIVLTTQGARIFDPHITRFLEAQRELRVASAGVPDLPPNLALLITSKMAAEVADAAEETLTIILGRRERLVRTLYRPGAPSAEVVRRSR